MVFVQMQIVRGSTIKRMIAANSCGPDSEHIQLLQVDHHIVHNSALRCCRSFGDIVQLGNLAAWLDLRLSGFDFSETLGFSILACIFRSRLPCHHLRCLTMLITSQGTASQEWIRSNGFAIVRQTQFEADLADSACCSGRSRSTTSSLNIRPATNLDALHAEYWMVHLIPASVQEQMVFMHQYFLLIAGASIVFLVEFCCMPKSQMSP